MIEPGEELGYDPWTEKEEGEGGRREGEKEVNEQLTGSLGITFPRLSGCCGKAVFEFRLQFSSIFH